MWYTQTLTARGLAAVAVSTTIVKASVSPHLIKSAKMR